MGDWKWGLHAAAPQGLRYDLTAGVLSVIFNAPRKRNAISVAMFRAVPQILGDAVRGGDVDLVVFRGAAGNFSSGADTRDFDDGGLELNQRLSAEAFAAVSDCPLPTLSVIEGHCIGSGVSIAAACDFRFAAPGAKFFIPATRLGIVYPPAELRRLCALVGVGGVRRMLFRSAPISGTEALSMGLVDELHNDLDGAVASLLGNLREQSSDAYLGAKLSLDAIIKGSTADMTAVDDLKTRTAKTYGTPTKIIG